MREIKLLKAYLYNLVLIACLAGGCVEKKTDTGSGKADQTQLEERKSAKIDFAANAMEDLAASNNMKDIICQNWDYYEDAKDAAYVEPSTNIDVVYRGYSIFSDGTMIKDPRGNILAGKWSINDKVKPITISFELENGRTETNELAYLMPFEMKLAKTEEGKKNIVDLRAEAIRYRNVKDDPFYISNNLWRFKPAQPESDEQIKQRLKDCIHFFILFYDHKIKADAHEVLFTGLPSCFKWYGGAIYLQKERELDGKWVNSFYNKEQAMKAYKLADKLMSSRFTWPKKESNWLKLNVAVLRQMEKKMDSL